MNKETQSIVVTLLGGLLISITLSHRFTSYVRPGFAPLLLIGGGILVLVGVVSLVLAIRSDAKDAKDAKKDKARATLTAPAPARHDHDDPAVHGDPHDHDHDKSKAPWLLLLPVLVLLLVAPPALGADAVARNASSQALAGVDVVARSDSTSKDGAGGGGGYKFNDGSGSAADSTGSRRTMHFPALPAGDNPPVGMKDLILRALYDADNSVEGVPVTVTGFIAPRRRRVHRRLHGRPDRDQLLRGRRQPDAAAHRRGRAVPRQHLGRRGRHGGAEHRDHGQRVRADRDGDVDDAGAAAGRPLRALTASLTAQNGSRAFDIGNDHPGQ